MIPFLEPLLLQVGGLPEISIFDIALGALFMLSIAAMVVIYGAYLVIVVRDQVT